MSVESNNLTSSLTILQAVETALEAVTISGVVAFTEVIQFDLADWETAVRRLILPDKPVAMVLWNGEDYESTREETVLTVRRTSTVEILFSDFALGDPTTALIGDDANPGTLGLLDAVLPAITGVLIDADNNLNPVWLEPVAVERINITQEDQNESPGRNIISLTVAVRGPFMQVGVGESTV